MSDQQNQREITDAFWAQQAGRDKLANAEAEANRQEHYEETIIKRILRGAGQAPSNWGVFVNECRERTGLDHLNFEWFRDRYPRFPLRLLPQKIAKAHRTTLIDVFKRFTTTRVFEVYQELAQFHGVNLKEHYAGLVFEMGELGACVLHNYPRLDHLGTDETARGDHGTRIVRPVGFPVVVYVVEQLPSLLDGIGKEWAQE